MNKKTFSKEGNSQSSLTEEDIIRSKKALEFAKISLNEIAIAKDLLKAHLSEEMKKNCDFSTLRVLDKSYVEEKFQDCLADILYQLNIKGELGYLHLLIESTHEEDILVPYRAWKYKLEIWSQYLANLTEKERETAKLPMVIPIVLYIGQKSPYPYKTDIMECFENPKLARETFLKPFKFIPYEESGL